MRYNGLAMFIDRAVNHVDHPLLTRHRRALILGAIREDVMHIPGTHRVIEHLSLSHFYKRPLPGGFIPLLWPGARYKANRFFGRAVSEMANGREASACVQLGRAAHLVADMACPVHVHRYPHDTDGFEWYVEAHRDELQRLPLAKVPSCKNAAEVVAGLSGYTARFPGDPTQHPLGRWLKRRRILKAIPQGVLAAQAREIVPVGCAYTAELFRCFLRSCNLDA